MLIYHLFADDGIESEVLSGFGRVVRVGINPRENEYSEVIAADAKDPPLKEKANLVVAHPECHPWATATRHIPDRETAYENQIPAARRAAQELGEHYIIENVPDAPLHDPVALTGRMFGLPIKFERSFETSFPVRQPTTATKQEREISWWYEYSRPIEWWKAVKGYAAPECRKDPLVKSGIPQAYMLYLIEHWLADVHGLSMSGLSTQTTISEAMK